MMARRARTTATDKMWLEVLESGSDWPPQQWIEAAKHFSARARRADVVFAVAPLERAFRECSSVDVLTCIADALVHHGVRWGAEGWLGSYLQSELFRDEVAEALERISAGGTRMDRVMPWLLDAGRGASSPVPHRTSRNLVAHWIGRDPDRLTMLLDRLETDPDTSSWVAGAVDLLLERNRLTDAHLERLLELWRLEPEGGWLIWLAAVMERHCPAKLSRLGVCVSTTPLPRYGVTSSRSSRGRP